MACHLRSSTLVKMWLFSLFLCLLVPPTVIYGFDCLVETLKCSRFRPHFPTHKDLFVSPTQMNEMCRQQDRFFKCLDQMVASGVTCGTGLPAGLLHAKALIKDLCINTSSWKKKYFELAPCINMQYTEFCTDLEFLGTVKPGDKSRSRCLLREEAVNCIAVTFAMNCGMDAGKLFHHLLRMTSDGGKNCYAVGSETLFLPTIQEAVSNEIEACNEVSSNLVKRTGSTPDPVESMEDSPYVGAQDFADDDLREDSASGTLEEFLSSTPFAKESPILFGALFTTARPGHVTTISPVNFRENKRFEDFGIDSALRFHGNNSVSQYARFPWLNSEEFSFCKNALEGGKKMYICTRVLRENSPICLEGGRQQNHTGLPINPEDIDPELGARLYAMFPYTYYFRPYEQMHERMFKHIHEYNKNVSRYVHELSTASLQTDTDKKDSATLSIHDLYISLYNKYTNDSIWESFDAGKAQEGESDDISSEYEDTTSDKPTAGDLLRNYVLAVTTPVPIRKDEVMRDIRESVASSGTASPKAIFDTTGLSGTQERLFTLLVEETEWLIEDAYKSPAKVDWLTPTVVRTAIETREDSQLVNITCGRLNECHPNASGVTRCLYYFALDDEVPKEDAKRQIRRRSSRKSPSDRELNSITGNILSLIEEGSGFLESSKPVIMFDESHEQSVPVTKFDSNRASVGQNEESAEISEEDEETEPVHFNFLETSAFDSMPYVDSEQSLKMKTLDASVSKEYDNSCEDGDPISKDENPTSGSFGESSSDVLDILRSLKNLENIISDGIDNIQID